MECVWQLPDGFEWGWQAKFIFELNGPQINKSVETALEIHPRLTRYTLCLPFDFTGPTKRGRGQAEKFEQMKTKWRDTAIDKGMSVDFRFMGRSDLLDALLDFDRDQGRLRYWFNHEYLSYDWFQQHLNEAVSAAGPRYTPEITVAVPISTSLEAFGLTAAWEEMQTRRIEILINISEKWIENLEDDDWETEKSPLPEEVMNATLELKSKIKSLLLRLADKKAGDWLPALLSDVESITSFALKCEHDLASALEAEHGPGVADSIAFRQHMAEVMISRPAQRLDATRDLVRGFEDFAEWLRTDQARLPNAPALVIDGTAGVGKTHAICDCAQDRHRRGLRSLVLFGEQFSTGEPWSQIRALLGFGADLSRDAMLDMLDAAGESTGFHLIIFVDALNETSPRRGWTTYLPQMVEQVRRHNYLKLCVSCRTSYIEGVIPEELELPRVAHRGFQGVEYDAFSRFFQFYKIELPAAPLLQPEFANPLFLKLICQSLYDERRHRFPDEGMSFGNVVNMVLETKNKRIASALDYDWRDRLVFRAMKELVGAMVMSRTRWLNWGEAKELVDKVGPSGKRDESLFHNLLREGLLIDERFVGDDMIRQEVIRIAFERIADYLIAEHYLNSLSGGVIPDAFEADGDLQFVVQDAAAVSRHRGLLDALALQLPERFRLELTEAVARPDLAEELSRIVCASLMWRAQPSISHETQAVITTAMRSRPTFADAMEGLLSVATRPEHPLNALWAHNLLADIAMADRDAVLCPYLHQTWETRGGADRLVRWALETNIDSASAELIELWATQLAWFLASADRRVRDYATKAIIRLLDHCPSRCASLLGRFVHVDDDYVVERCLASCYGALVRREDAEAVRAVCTVLWDQYFQSSRLPQNALIRDYVRLTMELGSRFDVLPAEATPDRFRPPYQSEWPLEIPSKAFMERFEQQTNSYPRLIFSCTEDDFFVYTVTSAVRQYRSGMSIGAGRWIFKHVLDMGYTPQRFAAFDWHMVETYGPGRGRPTWAERIGKKYQWIALYRLLGRLADHASVRPTDTTSETDEIALLQARRMRNIDPTHWLKRDSKPQADESWLSYDFSAAEDISDNEWLRLRDLPDSAVLVQTPHSYGGIIGLPISAFFQWNSKSDSDVIGSGPFRDARLNVSGYLVARDALGKCLAWLNEADINAIFSLGECDLGRTFLGEYPFGVPARLALASCMTGSELFGSGPPLQRATLAVVNAFELDAYSNESITVYVPSPAFVQMSSLRWNGATAYMSRQGRVCFNSPSALSDGHVSLVADPEYLESFLRETAYIMLWLGLEQKTTVSDGDGSRRWLDLARVHSFDGTRFETVMEKTISSSDQTDED